VRSNNRKFVPPPRSELGTSMEAVIHHFKLWTEGFNRPQGQRVCAGRIAARRVGRATWKATADPSRTGFYWRTPSVLSICKSCPCFPGVIWWPTWWQLIGTVDIVLGRCRPVNTLLKNTLKKFKNPGKYPARPEALGGDAAALPGSARKWFCHQAGHPGDRRDPGISTTEVGSIIGFYSLYYDEPGASTASRCAPTCPAPARR
jgi:hypothetical protein